MTETWVQIPAHRVLVVDVLAFTQGYVGVDQHGDAYQNEDASQATRFRRTRDGRTFKLARKFGQDVTFTAITAAGIVLEEA